MQETDYMKIISIHQPAYLPWLGYFHKIIISDVFIFLDTVQFEKNSFTNRNKILTKNGPMWLTVPVGIKGHISKVLCDMQISDDERWKHKHIESIKLNYSKAPYFDNFFYEIEQYILYAGHSFCDFLYGMTEYFLKVLKIDTRILRSSSLPVGGAKHELIKNLCSHMQGDVYISGVFGRDYLDVANFAKDGIKVVFQDYKHPVYQQLHDTFQSGMGIVDLLMNIGEKKAKSVIMSDNIQKKDLEDWRYESQS